MRRIFVCGSLRRGEINHDRFVGFGNTLIATGTVGGVVLKNLGKYPALIPSSNDLDRVVGEVYEIPDRLAEAVDRFERDEGYEARQVTVVSESREGAGRIEAEAYFFAHPDRIESLETVEGGDWARHDHVRPGS